MHSNPSEKCGFPSTGVRGEGLMKMCEVDTISVVNFIVDVLWEIEGKSLTPFLSNGEMDF